MYIGVPSSVPVTVRNLDVGASSFASPQSSSFTSGQRPDTLIMKTLSGLRSRWMMPLPCAALSADAISSIATTASLMWTPRCA